MLFVGSDIPTVELLFYLSRLWLIFDLKLKTKASGTEKIF
jgi:hypothetical protein